MKVPHQMNLNEVDLAISFIRLFENHQCTQSGYNELINACESIISQVPFMEATLKSTITRCRKNDDKLFYYECDISYNKTLKNIYQGRFNSRFQSLFYGSLPTFNEQNEFKNYGNQLPLVEVCKELTTHQSLNFPSIFTYSKWQSQNKLRIISLCFEERHLNENFAVKKTNTEFINFHKPQYTSKEWKTIISVWEYFSNLSSSWDSNFIFKYNILNAFFHSYIHISKLSKKELLDGIIYPSAMSEGKGLNIALFPNSVDKNLKLESVYLYKLNHRGLPHGFQHIPSKITIEDNILIYEPIFEKEWKLFYHPTFINFNPSSQ